MHACFCHNLLCVVWPKIGLKMMIVFDKGSQKELKKQNKIWAICETRTRFITIFQCPKRMAFLFSRSTMCNVIKINLPWPCMGEKKFVARKIASDIYKKSDDDFHSCGRKKMSCSDHHHGIVVWVLLSHLSALWYWSMTQTLHCCVPFMNAFVPQN